MTDNEIIKALECCVNDTDHLVSYCDGNGKKHKITIKDIADLINRQKAEIESLKIANEKLYDANKSQEAEIEKLTINMNAFGLGMISARADAVKEFAERLKKRGYPFSINGNPCSLLVSEDEIDILVKEFMEGKSHGMA